MKNAIALAGFTGSGKTTSAHFISDMCPDYSIISTGDISRRYLQLKNIEPTHENLQNATQQIVQEYGDNYISLAFEDPTIKENIIIDSIRRVSDIIFLKKTFQNVQLLFLHCNDENRFKRLVKRNRATDPKNILQFREMMELEKSWGVHTLQEGATLVIDNNSSVESLNNNLKRNLHNV